MEHSIDSVSFIKSPNTNRLSELIHNIANGDRNALAELYELTNKDV